ncbi:MAG: hypothetical protein A2W33_05395 [Chloroflexi bacterium RBG_16_52_11]|nr:MAG: hypothetical protein A2W33_05395 [Chloroflexi bacterium RBG_16_52_11]
MTDPDIPKYAALLKQLYILRDFNEAQIAHLTTRLERVEAPKNDSILLEGEEGNGFYLVFKGGVKLSRHVEGADQTMGILGSGEYFGEEALLLNRLNPLTVTSLSEPAIVLRLSPDDFFEIVAEHPQVYKDLNSTIESRHLAEIKNFDWIGEEETVTMIVRKHVFFFLRSLLIPVLLAGLSLFGLYYSLIHLELAATDLLVVFSLMGLFFSAFLGVWNYLNWENDYYILTNQRVVWLERVIILYYSRREARLPQILAVNVSSSFFGRLIGYGNVEVRTFTGAIHMKKASHPYRFASFIEDAQGRARETQKKYEAENKDKVLRQTLGMEKSEKPEPQSVTTGEGEAASKPKRPNVFRQTLDTFMQIRFVQGAVITYRKHWMLLLKKSFLPLLFLIGFTILVVFLARAGLLMGSCFPALGALLYLGIFLWWLYIYLDWSNDIYQLTPDQILDVKRKPLGEEIKKTAPLESILSLEHTREGIVQLIFNYGNVISNVGQAQFIFSGVKNPDEVQQEIASYIEALRRKKEEDENLRERENMLDWLSSYHRQSEKLEEIEKKTDWDLFPG